MYRTGDSHGDIDLTRHARFDPTGAAGDPPVTAGSAETLNVLEEGDDAVELDDEDVEDLTEDEEEDVVDDDEDDDDDDDDDDEDDEEEDDDEDDDELPDDVTE